MVWARLPRAIVVWESPTIATRLCRSSAKVWSLAEASDLLYLPPPSQELLFRRVGKQVRMAPFQCVIQEIQVLLSLLGHSVLHRSGTDWDCQAQSPVSQLKFLSTGASHLLLISIKFYGRSIIAEPLRLFH